MAIVLTRKKLHEQVWLEPMGDLSRRLGITSARLRGACKTMGVPVPAPAHWSALRAGQEIARPELLPHDGPDLVRIGSKAKESLVDWVIRTTPPMPEKQKPAAPSQPGRRLLPLQVWAQTIFGEHAPHSNTLLRWVHEGRIYPPPKKIARKWWVSPAAEYVAD